MRILGLDASTSTIGIAVIQDKPLKLIHYEYYKPDKSQDELNMLTKARDYILAIAKKYKIDDFVIEDYVRFMGGKSTAGTTIPLAILNMTIRLAVLDCLNIIPKSLNVMKIRHTLKTDKQLPKKEDIPELVGLHLQIPFPWLYKTNRKKQQVIMVESYDIADAIAVALAWVKLQSRPVKLPARKISKKKK